MDNKFESLTTITPKVDFRKSVIEIDVVDKMNCMIVNHYKEICNTKEDMIRKALIALGWIPPKETDPREAQNEDLYD